MSRAVEAVVVVIVVVGASYASSQVRCRSVALLGGSARQPKSARAATATATATRMMVDGGQRLKTQNVVEAKVDERLLLMGEDKTARVRACPSERWSVLEAAAEGMEDGRSQSRLRCGRASKWRFGRGRPAVCLLRSTGGRRSEACVEEWKLWKGLQHAASVTYSTVAADSLAAG